MAKIPYETIEEIKNSNDIVSVISEKLDLKQKGSNFVGLCPFHQDTNPSFTVSPHKQIFKCFVCNKGGNVFQFIQEYDSISFVDSVKLLANKVGIDVSQYNVSTKKISDEDKKAIDVLEEAKEYFKYLFSTLDENSMEKKYITKRLIDDEIINQFEIGFVPKGTNIQKFLESKNFETSDIVNSGLLKINEDAKIVNIFFNRLMIPLKDLYNNTIGFVGRVIGNDSPKYLNSPTTKIFNKSNYFFNLNNSINHIKKNDSLIIVEGPLDVIGLWKINIKNVIGTMGTAISNKQIDTINKLSNNIKIFFDNDNPGFETTMKLAASLLKFKKNVEVINLNSNLKDANEAIESKGDNYVIDRITNSISIFEFFINRKFKNIDLNSLEEINKIKMEFFNLLSLINYDLIKIDFYIKKVSEILDIEFSNLKNDFKNNFSNIFTSINNNLDQKTNLYNQNIILTEHERLQIEVIKFLFLKKECFEQLRKQNPYKMFKDIFYQLYCYINDQYNSFPDLKEIDISKLMIDFEKYDKEDGTSLLKEFQQFFDKDSLKKDKIINIENEKEFFNIVKDLKIVVNELYLREKNIKELNKFKEENDDAKKIEALEKLRKS